MIWKSNLTSFLKSGTRSSEPGAQWEPKETHSDLWMDSAKGNHLGNIILSSFAFSVHDKLWDLYSFSCILFFFAFILLKKRLPSEQVSKPDSSSPHVPLLLAFLRGEGAICLLFGSAQI